MNLESIQHILTAQMISSVQEGELCRSLRYLAESTELTEAEVNNLPNEARSFVLAAIPNEEAGNALQWYRLADTEQLISTPDYHFLLDHEWCTGQAAHLVDVASLEQVNLTDTAVRLKKR